jgi:hypothetical protein
MGNQFESPWYTICILQNSYHAPKFFEPFNDPQLPSSIIQKDKIMKTYLVFVDGVQVGMIKASGHNAAEKKAQKKYPGKNVSVEYTEL